MLGRFSNNLKLGLVGYPNVGKSLVFNTLSKLHVNSENYPFATIVRRFLVLSPAYRRASRAVTDATRSFDCVLNLLTWLGAKLRSRACTKRGLRLAVQALESGVQSSCLSQARFWLRADVSCNYFTLAVAFKIFENAYVPLCFLHARRSCQGRTRGCWSWKRVPFTQFALYNFFRHCS
jgi:50S ribosome-binding GTPase